MVNHKPKNGNALRQLPAIIINNTRHFLEAIHSLKFVVKMFAVSQRNWNIGDCNAWIELEEDVQSSAGLAQQVEIELHDYPMVPQLRLECFLIELWPCYDFACNYYQHKSDKISLDKSLTQFQHVPCISDTGWFVVI